MKLFYIFIILLITASCSTCNDEIKLKETEECNIDSECVLVGSICDEPKAVNKCYGDEYEKKIEKLEKATLCQSIRSSVWPENISAVCKNNKCVIQYP